MKALNLKKISSQTLWGGIAVGFTVLLMVAVLVDSQGNMKLFSQVVAGGLYQGMLIFMVAAGLSIVFGLMDVLNFAQGSLLMVGAYVGFDILSRMSASDKTNAFLLTLHVMVIGPILAVILWELTARLILPRIMKTVEIEHSSLFGKIQVAVLTGVPLGFVVGSVWATDFSGESDIVRVIFAVVVALIAMLSFSRDNILFGLRWLSNEGGIRFRRGMALLFNEEASSSDHVDYDPQFKQFDLNKEWLPLAFGVVVTALVALVLNNTEVLMLRFGVAAIAAILAGSIAGIVMEIVFIRPTYVRPFFQIVLTFGLALVIREGIEYRYDIDPKGTLGGYLPEFLQGTFPPAYLRDLFPSDFETTILNYWIFMIIMGLLMMIGVQLLLMRTRIGIIIRAGVQDSQMVEALGVNVRLVFTGVFALGAAIAAMGGIISAGFLNIDTTMGDLFLLQAIAVVIIGGLGSYAGTSLTAIVIGITRSVAAYFSRRQFNTDAPAPIVVLLLLCLVLYVKPSGLFGKEH